MCFKSGQSLIASGLGICEVHHGISSLTKASGRSIAFSPFKSRTMISLTAIVLTLLMPCIVDKLIDALRPDALSSEANFSERKHVLLPLSYNAYVWISLLDPLMQTLTGSIECSTVECAVTEYAPDTSE
eukprot:GHVO01061371.1.p2 GENE.GHVO01061371.1~~GHVO01061371.1.p2  ORF type:complete len:129 (+),score=3.11 GHVO01061371.1:152-538(+)